MSNWYLQNGKDSDVVISTRVRLARNIQGFNFENKCSKEDKKNILIVCGTGRGTAQLLMYQFKDNFGKYLNQIYTSDALGIKNVDFTDIDYVITTVPIAYSVPVPILEIKSFVEDRDVKTFEDE